MCHVTSEGHWLGFSETQRDFGAKTLELHQNFPLGLSARELCGVEGSKFNRLQPSTCEAALRREKILQSLGAEMKSFRHFDWNICKEEESFRNCSNTDALVMNRSLSNDRLKCGSLTNCSSVNSFTENYTSLNDSFSNGSVKIGCFLNGSSANRSSINCSLSNAYATTCSLSGGSSMNSSSAKCSITNGISLNGYATNCSSISGSLSNDSAVNCFAVDGFIVNRSISSSNFKGFATNCYTLNSSLSNCSTMNSSTKNSSTMDSSTKNSSTMDSSAVNSSTMNSSPMNSSTKNNSTINSRSMNGWQLNSSALHEPFVIDVIHTESTSPNCILPPRKSSTLKRLNQTNQEEQEEDWLGQGQTPKVTSSSECEDDEPVPAKRLCAGQRLLRSDDMDVDSGRFVRWKKWMGRNRESKLTATSAVPSFAHVTAFSDVTSSVDVTASDDRKSARRLPRSRTMTEAVKTDHCRGQSPDSTSNCFDQSVTWGTRMSCPFTEAHVTSGCGEWEVAELRRKYWCQTACLPPRDRIFVEPHWTKASCAVASYELYCHSLKSLLLQGETAINQAGHEPAQLRRREDEEEEAPRTTDEDEEDEEEDEDEDEEEQAAKAGESSPSIGDRLRDQHNLLYADYCRRCPGFESLDPNDQLTIIDLGRWSNLVFVTACRWLPGQQALLFRHLANRLPTKERTLFESSCQRLRGISQRLSWLSQRLASLDLDAIEEALISSLLFIASDDPNLRRPNLIECLRYEILTTFQAYITAKEGSSSDRLIRLLSHVPAIRQVAHELHDLQRSTVSVRVASAQREDKEDRKVLRSEDIDSSVCDFHSRFLQEGIAEKPRIRKEKEVKDAVEKEREEEEKQKEEEAVERKNNYIEEEEDEEDAKFKCVKTGSDFLENSTFSFKFSSTSSGFAKHEDLTDLKTFDLVCKDFRQKLKRCNQDSKISGKQSCGSFPVSKVLSRYFNYSFSDSNVLADNFIGSSSRIKSQG